jgi:hypothetical protein
MSRNTAIKQVTANTNQAIPGWTEHAYNFLLNFAQHHEQFLTEEVVNASRQSVPWSHDNRAWGAVIQKASRDRVISKQGYRNAKSSHYSPKPLWISNIFID